MPSGSMSGMATSTDRVRENRIRRMAERQGLRVVKSRRRDRRAFDFGGFMLLDANSGSVVSGAHPLPFSLNLDEVEGHLTSGG